MGFQVDEYVKQMALNAIEVAYLSLLKGAVSPMLDEANSKSFDEVINIHKSKSFEAAEQLEAIMQQQKSPEESISDLSEGKLMILGRNLKF